MKEYFNKEFGADCFELDTKSYEDTKFSDIFNAFTSQNLDNQIELDCLINEITINNGRLSYSPEIALKHKYESILPAFGQLIENETCSFDSLRDIKDLNAIVGKKNKKVRVNIADNGDFYLTYDDRQMNKKEIEKFENSFLSLLKIPLRQKISPFLFSEGKSYRIDHVMRVKKSLNFTSDEKDILTNLLSKEY